MVVTCLALDSLDSPYPCVANEQSPSPESSTPSLDRSPDPSKSLIGIAEFASRIVSVALSAGMSGCHWPAWSSASTHLTMIGSSSYDAAAHKSGSRFHKSSGSSMATSSSVA